MIGKKETPHAGMESLKLDAIDTPKIEDALQALDADAAENDCSTVLEAYYDTQRKEYYIRIKSGWIAQTEWHFKRRLRQVGISVKVSEGTLLSPADVEILRVQDHHAVGYAGPLAGYMEGVIEQYGNHLLVTKSPQLVEPVEGDFPVLEKTINAVLDDPDQSDQLHHFYGWLQVAVKALRSGSLMTGQALVMAGPAGCGKSLLQNLITVMLGGRSAKPYQYMTGSTPFNADLFQAEHLMIEDETPSTDYRSRRNLGSYIKQLTVNQDQRLHAKNRDAIMLKPFWRVSITLNDEAEDLHVLPPIDSSLEDKLIILRAFKRTLPMPTSTEEEQKAFWKALCAEMPAFLDWLLNTFCIPKGLISPRFGITHFHHPILMDSLRQTSNEAQLLALVDEYITLPFIGTAAELDSALRQQAGRQADKLLYFNGAAGAYLARLAKTQQSRVIKKRTAKNNQWEIFPEQD